MDPSGSIKEQCEHLQRNWWLPVDRVSTVLPSALLKDGLYTHNGATAVASSKQRLLGRHSAF